MRTEKRDKRFHLRGVMEARGFKLISGARPYNQIWEKGNIKVNRYSLMGSTSLRILGASKILKSYGINVSDPNREQNINNFIKDLDELLKPKLEVKSFKTTLGMEALDEINDVLYKLGYVAQKIKNGESLDVTEMGFLKVHNII